MGAAIYLLSWQVHSWDTSLLLATFAALPLAAVVRWLWRTRLPVLWVLAPYLLFHAVTAGSALLIESGAYVPELDTWGEPNGTAARLCIEVSLLFVVAGWSAGRRIDTVRQCGRAQRHAIGELVLIALAGTTLAIPTVNLVTLGAPLLMGMDRVAFYQEAGPLHLRAIVLFLAAVPSLSWIALTTSSGVLRGAAIVLIASALAVMALTGEKFHGLVFAIYAAALPAVLLRRNAALKSIGLAAALVLCLSIGLINYHYGSIYQAVDVGEFAIGRVAAQAEVPWAVDLGIQQGKTFGVASFITSELTPIDNAPQGMERLMLEVAPHAFVVNFLDSGSRFTMGFPAILKVYFGAAAILSIPVFGALVGLFTRLILHCLATRRLFALWMAMNLVGYGALLDQVLLLGNLFQLGFVEPTRFAWLFLLLLGLALPAYRPKQ